MRKIKFEEAISKLEEDRKDISNQILPSELAPELIRQLKEYFDQVRSRLDDASFEDKRRLIDLLDVNGKLAIENDKGLFI